MLITHICAGSVAVLVGLISLLAPKPLNIERGRTHRRTGNYFLYAMIVVIGTATILTIISFNPYFAGLTVAATIAVFSGYRVLRRKRPDLNPADRATAIDWIVTLIIFAVGLYLVFLAVTGGIVQNLPVVYSLGIGSLLYAAYDLYRFVRPLGFPFSPNLWLYEHLVKMLGGYFGAVAAFSGSVLVILPPPWRQLWATSLGQFLAITMVIYYYRKSKNQKNRIGRIPVDKI
ncbi:MAG: hypothetical protein WKF90_13300 [Pyrinomonadaceae bacterium]